MLNAAFNFCTFTHYHNKPYSVTDTLRRTSDIQIARGQFLKAYIALQTTEKRGKMGWSIFGHLIKQSGLYQRRCMTQSVAVIVDHCLRAALPTV